MMQEKIGAMRSSGRNQLIEILRIIAAYSIVAFHAKVQPNDLFYSGLIAFLVLSPFVDVSFNWGKPRSATALAKSLLIPWACWMVIYGILNLVSKHAILPPGPLILSILYGTSAHLWFLPFIFFVLVALNRIKTRASPSLLYWPSLAVAIMLLCTTALWRPVSLTLPLPLPQWLHAAPAIFVGIALGTARFVRRGQILAFIGLSFGLIVSTATGLPGIKIPYLVGIGVTAVITAIALRWSPRRLNVQAVAECTMGVYLSHIIWLRIAGAVFGHSNYIAVTVAFLAALASVWIARSEWSAGRLAPLSRRVFG